MFKFNSVLNCMGGSTTYKRQLKQVLKQRKCTNDFQ